MPNKPKPYRSPEQVLSVFANVGERGLRIADVAEIMGIRITLARKTIRALEAARKLAHRSDITGSHWVYVRPRED